MTAFPAAVLCFRPAVLILLVLLSERALAQQCPCTPECVSLSTCISGRIVFRTDCACCRVCARQAGEKCGEVETPCDSQLGLTCDKEKNICQGPAGLSVQNTTSNATTVSWHQGSWTGVKFSEEFKDNDTIWRRQEVPSGNSSVRLLDLRPNATYFVTLEDANNSSEVILVMTKGVCEVNGTRVEEGESIDDGCERKCTCEKGGNLTCVPRCLHRPGTLSDPLCTETPDPNDSCCVMYMCAQKTPHLIITGRAPSSVSVAWDDFKPPSYERGYVLEYKVAGVEVNWTQLQANNTPMSSLEGLVPNTRYQIRVSIWEDQDTLGSASEVINVNTTDGCVKNNRTYRVDDDWYEGCEARCTCRQNSTVECSERCPRPLYRVDSFPADPRCSQNPDKDSCCVSVLCDRDNLGADAATGNILTRCPDPVQTHSDQCVSSCKSNSDCSAPEELCCPVACGATICTNITSWKANQSDICLNIICGPNAQCHLQDGTPKCQCTPGTEGNPNDFTQGCSAVETKANEDDGVGCKFKNTTYPSGERFFDGCEYKCLCNQKAEIECQPRCTPLAESLNDPTCHVVPDPEDSCCNITLCTSHPPGKGVKNSSKKGKNEFTDSSDVCHYQNKTYRTNDIIAEGCSKMCACKAGGIVSCLPRCLTLTQTTGPGCLHLTDPNDPCCNVTVCNNSFPDVERDNNSSTNASFLPTTTATDISLVDMNSTLNLFNSTEEIETSSVSTETTLVSTETTAVANETSPLIALVEMLTTSTSLSSETTEGRAVNDVEDETTIASSTVTEMNVTSSSTEMTMEPSTDSQTQIFPQVKDHFNELGDETVTFSDTTTTTSSMFGDGNTFSIAEVKSADETTTDTPTTTSVESFESIYAHSQEESHINNALAPNTDTTTTTTTTTAMPSTTETESNTTTEVEMTSSETSTMANSSESSENPELLLRITSKTTDLFYTENSTAVSETFTSSTIMPTSDSSDATNATNSTDSDHLLKITNNLNNVDVINRVNSSEKDDTAKITNTLDNEDLINNLNASTILTKIKNATKDTASINELNGDSITTYTEMITSSTVEMVTMSTSVTTEDSVTSSSTTPDEIGNVIKYSTTEKNPFFFGEINSDKKSRMLDTKHTGLNKNEFCEWDDWRLDVGGEMEDGCRRLCRCLEGRKISCKPITCPYHQQPEISGCLEWDYDRFFQPTPGNCCAVAICKNKMPVKTGAACEFRGRRFSHLEPIPESLVIACDQECRCFDGNVTCDSRCPPVSLLPPPLPGCPPKNIRLVLMPGDECCREWRCEIFTGAGPQVEEVDSFMAEFVPPGSFQTVTPSRPQQNPFLITVPREEDGDAINFHSPYHFDPKDGLSGFLHPQKMPGNLQLPEENKTAECYTEDGPRKVGDQWEEDSPSCRSRRCTCVILSTGNTSVECTGGCSTLERYLQPSPECPLPVLVTPDDPCFCPYVMCNKTDSKRNIKNLTAVALNSTTVRVRLVIPQLYVGLHGQVEVLYTDDATQTNTSTWNKEVFSHRDDLFAEAAMQHDLHGLVPDTTYYLKADVRMLQTDYPITSSVVTVHMPPLPASSTTTTSLPLQMTINPQFNVTDQQARSLQISWRSLTSREKRVIDGVRIKYRVQGEEVWGLTPLIHRDVITYVLRNLRPNTAYEVDMAIVSPDDVTTEIETVPPSVFRTSPIHDDYAFNITLMANKVLTRVAELYWTGVPFPMHKYVNLYAVYYRMDQDVEPKAIYKPAKVEQLTLEDLKPGNRYSIWMEAYLSNGDIRKSNVLEIMTKPGSPLKQPEKEKLEVTSPEGNTAAEVHTSNSYYEALVAVAVVAAVCILGFAALLVFLLRRQGSATAPISAHKSQSAYDNPTYKPSYEGEIENGKTPGST